jgi:sulfoxide reductase heme-binding subunit YedZ
LFERAVLKAEHWNRRELTMETDQSRLRGFAVGILLALVITLTIIGSLEDLERALHWSLRATARLSFVFWFVTFVASPLQVAGPQRLGRWLCSRRSSFGLALAGSHFVHISTVATLLLLYAHTTVPLIIKVFGGFGVVVLSIMATISFSSPRRWLGPHKWALIHRLGTWYLGILFSYGLLLHPVLRERLTSPIYLPFVTLIVIALLLRLRVAIRTLSAKPLLDGFRS